MRKTMKLFFALASATLLALAAAPAYPSGQGNAGAARVIATSDTILSGMAASLLPPDRYSVEAILPPGQCPGHYDVKLSDIEKTKKADLIIAFKGMPFMDTANTRQDTRLLVDAEGRNWMAPDAYVRGLGLLAEGLAKRFPADRDEIMKRKRDTIRSVRAGTKTLSEKLRRACTSGMAVIASSMQKEQLAWMGFRVVGEYGRPEAISAREIVQLIRIGRGRNAVLVVDNLQSGPDAGKGIAEALGTPRVVLTNFPSEKGYLATLGDNVNAVVSAVRRVKQ